MRSFVGEHSLGRHYDFYPVREGEPTRQRPTTNGYSKPGILLPRYQYTLGSRVPSILFQNISCDFQVWPRLSTRSTISSLYTYSVRSININGSIISVCVVGQWAAQVLTSITHNPLPGTPLWHMYVVDTRRCKLSDTIRSVTHVLRLTMYILRSTFICYILLNVILTSICCASVCGYYSTSSK